MTTREPEMPHDAVAERALIGMLIEGAYSDLFEQCAYLQPDNFYSHTYRPVWREAKKLHARGEAVNLVTLHEALRDAKVIGEGRTIASISDITECANDIPTKATPEQCARAIFDTARRRHDVQRGAMLANLAYEGGDAYARYLDQLRDELVSEPATPGKSLLPIMHDVDVEAMPPARGIIGNILFEDTLAILFAPSRRWKSFVAISWGMCVATATPWLGRSVVSGPVVYIAGEGAGGIGARIRAWKRHHGITGQTDMRVLLRPVQLLDDQSVAQLIESIRALVSGTPAMIIIDTLSRSMAGGDENTGKDGSQAIAACDRIREAFHCCVLVVAHPGKDDTRGIRGWSGYFGAADTVIKIDSDATQSERINPGDVITLKSEKPKDTEPFEDIHLTTTVAKWASNDSSIASSLVIVASESAGVVKAEALTAKRQAVLDVLPAGGLNANEWQRLAKDKANIARSTFFDILKELQRRELVELQDDGRYICLPAGPVQSKTSPVGPVRTSPVQSTHPLGGGLDWTTGPDKPDQRKALQLVPPTVDQEADDRDQDDAHVIDWFENVNAEEPDVQAALDAKRQASR